MELPSNEPSTSDNVGMPSTHYDLLAMDEGNIDYETLIDGVRMDSVSVLCHNIYLSFHLNIHFEISDLFHLNVKGEKQIAPYCWTS